MAHEAWTEFVETLDHLEGRVEPLEEERIRIVREAKERTKSVMLFSLLIAGFTFYATINAEPARGNPTGEAWVMGLIYLLFVVALCLILKDGKDSFTRLKRDCRSHRARVVTLENRVRRVGSQMETEAAHLGVAATQDIIERAERVLESATGLLAGDVVISCERKMWKTFGGSVFVVLACAGYYFGKIFIS